jgi:hypothetical protein
LNGVSAMDDFVEYRTIIHEVELARSTRASSAKL